MWACPNLITGAFRLLLAPCSLLPVFPVSGGCVAQGNHLPIYSSCPLSTSGSHSKRLYFSQALLLGSLY